jgi:hypothetical protein
LDGADDGDGGGGDGGDDAWPATVCLAGGDIAGLFDVVHYLHLLDLVLFFFRLFRFFDFVHLFLFFALFFVLEFRRVDVSTNRSEEWGWTTRLP